MNTPAHDVDTRSNLRPETLLRFPSEAEQVYRDVQKFRRLTPTERFLAIVDLMASGQALMMASPHREAAEQQRKREKEELRSFYRELLAHHGR